MNSKPIKRLFIANRGEILRRIALTAQKLGIECVSIYQGDHVPTYLYNTVNEFYFSERRDVAEYLDIQHLLNLAQTYRCDALHPGFGFLSENPDFATAVIKAGLTWIGPSPEAIANMASKSEAGLIAASQGVPCIPGLKNIKPDLFEEQLESIISFGEKAGYPIIIKAAFGGGGKGMRIVEKKADLMDALRRASSEAQNAFGNGELIIEKYLQNPRHVEVQVFGDLVGNIVIFGDRDCTLQRRHQKIIEEAPAPNIDHKVRHELHQCASKLAKAVGYSSAGTVEFMLIEKNKQQEFFFLEMNTRLQVEHPVTEEVFGVDLVEWQLRVAQGEPLPEAFNDLKPRGHSIEARLYAEDVEQKFFPCPGLVSYLQPVQNPGIRWELGTCSGEEISGSFDPMFAKLIATDGTRRLAIAKLLQTLNQFVFMGPKNNLEFLQSVCGEEDFINFNFGTSYLQQKEALLKKQREEKTAFLEPWVQMIFAEPLLVQMRQDMSNSKPNPRQISQNIFTGQGTSLSAIKKKPKNEKITIDLPTLCLPGGNHTQVVYGNIKKEDGNLLPFCYADIKAPKSHTYYLFLDGCLFSHHEKENARGFEEDGTGLDGENRLESPVPGKIVAVFCGEDQAVEKGEKLFVIESMKMEYEIQAPKAGLISQLSIKKGDSVVSGQILATLSDTDLLS